MLAAQPYKTND
jgi:hypothetical protein